MIMHRLAIATAYASILHGEQLRKGTETPYISHLLQVTGMVLEMGANETTAVAAMLHDTLEDTDATPDAIRSQFGSDVLALVLACSEPDTEAPWLERKKAYLEHLKAAPEAAVVISLADKLHNLESTLRDLDLLGPALWERFTVGKEQQRWWYSQLNWTFLERLGETPWTFQFSRSYASLVRLS